MGCSSLHLPCIDLHAQQMLFLKIFIPSIIAELPGSMVNLTVITAGSRAGASAFALSRAQQSQHPVTDLVTATRNWKSRLQIRQRLFLKTFLWRIVWSFTSYVVFFITLHSPHSLGSAPLPGAQFLYPIISYTTNVRQSKIWTWPNLVNDD